MDFEINLANLTHDKLEEECLHLQRNWKELCGSSEADAQHMHELKCKLKTVTAAKLFLSQELEQLTINSQQGSVDTKLQTEHDDLRRKHHKLNAEFATLQGNYDTIATENTKLRTKLETWNAEKTESTNSDSEACNERLIESLNVLEQENMDLLKKLDEQCADKRQQTMALAEKEKNIELMLDEVSCLEANMRYKREELEEKTRVLESAQEQLFEANSKINMLMSSPDHKDRKGNSLFAEVDDQRQLMNKLLAAQNKPYMEMQKTYNEIEYEIRRLKRKNSAMHTELTACSEIFCKADRTYQVKLNNRIQHLFNQNEHLEQEVKSVQQYLKDLADDKGTPWVGSMLNFCKQETDDLKDQLHSLHLKNANLEEQIRNITQDMVRWRFESLKSRCLLINRENLLTEHKIVFKPKNDVEYRITEAQEKGACPRIVSLEKMDINANTSATWSMDKKINDNETSLNRGRTSQTEESINSSSTPIVCLDDTTECNKENSVLSICKMQCNTPPVVKSEVHARKLLQETSSQFQIKSVETLNKEANQRLKEQQPQNSQLSSILCKRREINNLCPKKSVKFATNEATIFNISASPDMIDEAEKGNSNNENVVKHENNGETNVKAIRSKSNVIVRRVIVGSKPSINASQVQ